MAAEIYSTVLPFVRVPLSIPHCFDSQKPIALCKKASLLKSVSPSHKDQPQPLREICEIFTISVRRAKRDDFVKGELPHTVKKVDSLLVLQQAVVRLHLQISFFSVFLKQNYLFLYISENETKIKAVVSNNQQIK